MKAITVKQQGIINPNTDILGLVNDWENHLRLQVESGEISESTQIGYLRGWSKFHGWIIQEGIDLVDGDSIRSWLGDLNRHGNKPNTVNTWFSGVRAFFAWSVGNHRLLINPCERVKGSRRKGTGRTHLRSALTDSEVKRLLSQPDRTTAQGRRDYAILSLMLFTGIRSIEVVRADLDDLRTEGTRLVLYVQGKGKIEKDDYVVIPGPAEDAIHNWTMSRGSTPGPLFPSLSHRSSGERLTSSGLRHLVNYYFKKAEIRGRDKSAHSLRHSAITSAITHGAPVQKVRSMARHENLDTTMIYYHEVDRLDHPAEDFIDYDLA